MHQVTVTSPSFDSRVLDVEMGPVSVGGRTILEQNRVSVPLGAVTVFVGANGAGKTTAFRSMVGSIPRASQLSWADPTSNEVAPAAADVRLSGGPDDLPTDLTVAKYLAFCCGPDQAARSRLRELSANEPLRTLLRRKIGKLSTGQKQRVSVLGATIPSAKVVLLDEPFNGLDPQAVQWLEGVVKDLRHRGVGVVLSTHLLQMAERIADVVLTIHEGRMHQTPIGGSSHDSRRITVGSRPQAAELVRLLTQEGFSATAGPEASVLADAPMPVLLATAQDHGIRLVDIEEPESRIASIYFSSSDKGSTA